MAPPAMTPRRYSAVEGARRGVIAPAELHHPPGHDLKRGGGCGQRCGTAATSRPSSMPNRRSTCTASSVLIDPAPSNGGQERSRRLLNLRPRQASSASVPRFSGPHRAKSKARFDPPRCEEENQATACRERRFALKGPARAATSSMSVVDEASMAPTGPSSDPRTGTIGLSFSGSCSFIGGHPL